MRIKRFLFTLVLAVGLIGCGTTYYDKVGSAQVTNTTVLQMIGVAAQTQKITKRDAENLLKQVDDAQAGIEIAGTLDPTSGADKLKLSQDILAGINAYLLSRGVKK